MKEIEPELRGSSSSSEETTAAEGKSREMPEISLQMACRNERQSPHAVDIGFGCLCVKYAAGKRIAN